MRHGRVLVWCAIAGAFAGLARPVMQDAVQVAQVHAGVVWYAATDPYYILSMRLWSSQHQLAALFLHAGVTERTLSIAISALIGALSFAAIGAAALVAGARAWQAIAAGPVTVALGLTGRGLTYPTILLGNNFTWGAIGLPVAFLSIALLVLDCRRTAAFLLGAGLSIHFGLSSIACAAAVVFAVRDPDLRADLRTSWRWLAAGLSLAAISAIVFVVRLPAVSAADAAEAASFAHAGITWWDTHRQATAFTDLIWLPALLRIAIARFAMRVVRDPRATRLPQFVAATAILGCGIHALRNFSSLPVPDAVWIAMPARLVNFAAISAPGFVIGLVAHYLRDRSAMAERMLTAALTIVAIVFSTRLAFETPEHFSAIDEPANAIVFAHAAAQRGVLLTASDISDAQLRTRRPILLNGGVIDMVPYAPEAGAAINRALISAYGIDLRHPPADSLDGLGALPGNAGRELWEHRSIDDWTRVAHEWGITQILTPSDWQLALPVDARSNEYTLFTIPR